MNVATAQEPITAPVATSASYAPVGLVAVGVLLLTLSAKLQIPLWPVPMTMQTYVVLVIAMAYGTRLGIATLAGYLLAGALGVPVFAGTPEKGIGVPYMLGPTGGYLLGFLLSTYVMGKLAQHGWDRSLALSLAAMTLGHILILACGVAWLAIAIGLTRAIAVGLAPFLAATILKTVLAGLTLPLAWRWIAKVRKSASSGT
jgi:biotin transport system substrate-specific component